MNTNLFESTDEDVEHQNVFLTHCTMYIYILLLTIILFISSFKENIITK